MALTEQQQKSAQAPWSCSTEDLIDAMNALSNFENLSLFGMLGSQIVLDIQKAAVSRRIPIPQGFSKIIKSVDPTGQSGFTRRRAPYSPSGGI